MKRTASERISELRERLERIASRNRSFGGGYPYKNEPTTDQRMTSNIKKLNMMLKSKGLKTDLHFPSYDEYSAPSINIDCSTVSKSEVLSILRDISGDRSQVFPFQGNKYMIEHNSNSISLSLVE